MNTVSEHNLEIYGKLFPINEMSLDNLASNNKIMMRIQNTVDLIPIHAQGLLSLSLSANVEYRMKVLASLLIHMEDPDFKQSIIDNLNVLPAFIKNDFSFIEYLGADRSWQNSNINVTIDTDIDYKDRTRCFFCIMAGLPTTYISPEILFNVASIIDRSIAKISGYRDKFISITNNNLCKEL